MEESCGEEGKQDLLDGGGVRKAKKGGGEGRVKKEQSLQTNNTKKQASKQSEVSYPKGTKRQDVT